MILTELSVPIKVEPKVHFGIVMQTLKEAIDAAGGVEAVAAATKLTARAIYKWIAKDSLPRSEYTGESDYSTQIATATNGKLTKEQLLDIGRPKQATA